MTSATNLETRVSGGVHYRVGGSGEPLLLVHGLAGSWRNWCEVLPALVERYRVIAVDLPGHGHSEPPRRGASTADLASSVAAVLDAEAAGGTLVAGHSLGGLVSIRLARTRPELVRGLLLISPAGIASSTRAARAIVLTTATVRPGRMAAVFRHRLAGRAWYRRAVFRPWFVSDADALTPRATHGLLGAQPDHADVKTPGRALVADDPRRDLDAVACPVTILWGARDLQLPLADAFEYARRLRAGLRLVADCGHLDIVERPRAVVDALEDLAASV